MTAVKDAPASANVAATAWRTILVHVEPGKAAEARLEAAVALARRCDALLIGLGAELVEPVTFSDPYGSWDAQVLTALREQVRTNLARAEQAFKKHAAGIRSEWRSIEDNPAPAVARVARSADLIVAGGAGGGNGFSSADPAELALISGRPVLVVPAHGGALQAKSAVVAWKDTRESRRAVADALPLLAEADDVLVVEMCAEHKALADAQFRVSEVVEALKRHGVRARGNAAAVPDERIGETLEAEAGAIGADLIVAGCYGHSRLNEWFFGGVTRDLLRNPQRFVLLSH